MPRRGPAKLGSYLWTEALVHGLLNVDKPPGITSAGVLRVLRRRLGQRKLGHVGTLDPFATGILPVLLGRATRLAPFLLGEEKVYRTRIRLGISTDTLDLEGRILRECPLPEAICHEQLAEILRRFTGELSQHVPAYSAVRVDGERLHRKARRGEQVKRPCRQVWIHEIRLEGWQPPDIELLVRCGQGTYIRSLGEAIGEALHCGAHLRELRRLAVGPFCVDQALPLDRIDEAAARQRLLSPSLALLHLPETMLDDSAVQKVLHGQKLGAIHVPKGAASGSRVRLTDPQGELVAIGEVLPAARGVRVLRGFPKMPESD